MNGYVFQEFEPGCYTVGFYTPGGKWVPEGDYATAKAAAERVHYLNGGRAVDDVLGEVLNSGDGSYKP